MPTTDPASTRPRRRRAAASRGADALAGFDLGWHLPHLLRRAHFEAEARFVEVYGDAVTSRQLALLVAVAQASGASQRAIAKQIGLDANTCSDLVQRTIAKGWLVRERDPADARAWCLGLTREGRALVNRMAVPLAQRYADSVAARLTPAQRRQLAQLLRKMLDFHAPSSADRP